MPYHTNIHYITLHCIALHYITLHCIHTHIYILCVCEWACVPRRPSLKSNSSWFLVPLENHRSAMPNTPGLCHPGQTLWSFACASSSVVSSTILRSCRSGGERYITCLPAWHPWGMWGAIKKRWKGRSTHRFQIKYMCMHVRAYIYMCVCVCACKEASK